MANALTSVGTRHRLGTALFLAAAVISFLLSVGLWFTGFRAEGLFVGLWVPSILAAGAFWMTAVRQPGASTSCWGSAASR